MESKVSLSQECCLESSVQTIGQLYEFSLCTMIGCQHREDVLEQLGIVKYVQDVTLHLMDVVSLEQPHTSGSDCSGFWWSRGFSVCLVQFGFQQYLTGDC